MDKEKIREILDSEIKQKKQRNKTRPTLIAICIVIAIALAFATYQQINFDQHKVDERLLNNNWPPNGDQKN